MKKPQNKADKPSGDDDEAAFPPEEAEERFIKALKSGLSAKTKTPPKKKRGD